jgi:pimeloyl-ACP methyl ester carboxylesterase
VHHVLGRSRYRKENGIPGLPELARGERDSYLGSELAEPDREDVPNLDRVERLPEASHWVHHDEAERVNQLLIEFFAPGRATSTT